VIFHPDLFLDKLLDVVQVKEITRFPLPTCMFEILQDVIFPFLAASCQIRNLFHELVNCWMTKLEAKQ
jgi:hypothetical protein